MTAAVAIGWKAIPTYQLIIQLEIVKERSLYLSRVFAKNKKEYYRQVVKLFKEGGSIAK